METELRSIENGSIFNFEVVSSRNVHLVVTVLREDTKVKICKYVS